MTARDWERWAAACGVIFVVLILVTQFGFARPPSGGQALVDFYHQHRDAIRWREFLSGLALVFLLPFVAALRSALRREEDESSWASAAAFAGAVITAAVALTEAVLIESLAFQPPSDPRLALAVQNIVDVTGRFLSLPLAVFVGTPSFVIFKSHVLPTWVGWLGVLAAALNLLSSIRIAADLTGQLGNLALLAFAIWIAVVSVLLGRQKAAGQTVSAGALP